MGLVDIVWWSIFGKIALGEYIKAFDSSRIGAPLLHTEGAAPYSISSFIILALAFIIVHKNKNLFIQLLSIFTIIPAALKLGYMKSGYLERLSNDIQMKELFYEWMRNIDMISIGICLLLFLLLKLFRRDEEFDPFISDINRKIVVTGTIVLGASAFLFW